MMVTLDSVDGVREISKFELYKLLTGKDPSNTSFSMQIPPMVNVNPDNMPKVMVAVEKFRTGYSDYSSGCDLVRGAYDAGDYQTFRKELANLLCDIQND